MAPLKPVTKNPSLPLLLSGLYQQAWASLAYRALLQPAPQHHMVILFPCVSVSSHGALLSVSLLLSYENSRNIGLDVQPTPE